MEKTCKRSLDHANHYFLSQSIKLDSYLLIEWFQLDEKNYEVVTIVIMMLQFNVKDGQNLIISHSAFT